MRIVLASALLFGLFSATPVMAKGHRQFVSKITQIHDKSDSGFLVNVSGTVSSQSLNCRAGRAIDVRLNDVDIRFGQGTTDGSGRFSISGTGTRNQDYRITLFSTRRCTGDVVVKELG